MQNKIFFFSYLKKQSSKTEVQGVLLRRKTQTQQAMNKNQFQKTRDK